MSHRFPTTRWSCLLADPAADSARTREALETLARRYWLPIVAYVRARWARTDDDARDAAQEFFLWMVERGFLAQADPARGRFRGFLKTALANFLNDLERKRRTIKRGGSRRFLSFDVEPELPASPSSASPEQQLDELWRRELLAHAAEALEAELRERGKGVTFDVFRDFFLSEDDLDYVTIADRHGITTVDVSNRLTYAKQRYRAHLRAAVLETVQSDDDLRAELAWLLEDRPR